MQLTYLFIKTYNTCLHVQRHLLHRGTLRLIPQGLEQRFACAATDTTIPDRQQTLVGSALPQPVDSKPFDNQQMTVAAHMS